MTKQQILYIHGGMTHKNKENYINFLKNRRIKLEKKKKRRDEYLPKTLWDNFQVIVPRIPCQDNAQYEEWKIHCEKYLDLLDDNPILIWSSLGGIFLAKYLSENKLDKKILKSYIICPPFDDTIEGEDLVGGFELGDDLSLLMENFPQTTFMFSEDDPVIPIDHADKYKKALPDAEYIIYESKNGHFAIEEFPEIIQMIKKDVHHQSTS